MIQLEICTDISSARRRSSTNVQWTFNVRNWKIGMIVTLFWSSLKHLSPGTVKPKPYISMKQWYAYIRNLLHFWSEQIEIQDLCIDNINLDGETQSILDSPSEREIVTESVESFKLGNRWVMTSLLRNLLIYSLVRHCYSLYNLTVCLNQLPL